MSTYLYGVKYFVHMHAWIIINGWIKEINILLHHLKTDFIQFDIKIVKWRIIQNTFVKRKIIFLIVSMKAIHYNVYMSQTKKKIMYAYLIWTAQLSYCISATIFRDASIASKILPACWEYAVLVILQGS